MGTPFDLLLRLVETKSLWELWNLFLLGLARLIPAVAFSPFLGTKLLTDPVKIGFGVFLTFLFLPLYATKASLGLAFDAVFILALLKEVLVGGLLGFLFSLPFHAAQGAGILIDHQRGASSLQVNDPTTQSAASPIGQLYNFMMIVCFFLIGGHFFFFDAIFNSYEVFPVDQGLPPLFFTHKNPFWFTTLSFITKLLTITLQLSAPALIALLMSDLFLGIINRMAPQVQITFLLWSLKAFVGILLLWAGWWLVLKQLDTQGLAWSKTIRDLFLFFKQ